MYYVDMQKLVKIDEDILETLRKLAKAEQRSLANMLRIIIEDHQKSLKSVNTKGK